MSAGTQSVQAFLLTRQWHDSPTGITLEFWFSSDAGPLKVCVEHQQAIFFIRQKDVPAVARALTQTDGLTIKNLQLQNFSHEAIAGVYFQRQQDLYRARERLQNLIIPHYEADIRPVERYLMERFLTGPVNITYPVNVSGSIRNPRLRPGDYRPKLKLMSLDIETAYDSQALYSISLLCEHWKITLIRSENIGQRHSGTIEYLGSEEALLRRFIELVQEQDPDVLIGWNVVNFDLRFLQKKADSLQIPLTIGRDAATPVWRKTQTQQSHFFLLLPGRVVLDGIDTLKSATWNFASFSLEFVANQLLQRGKLIKSENIEDKNQQALKKHDPLYKAKEIKRLFLQDKMALAAYNMEDCQLVWDIFKVTELADFAIERARLTGLEMDRSGGSVAAFDNLYLPRLHRKGFVASSASDQPDAVSAPGGYVMNSRPGLFDSVLVLDYKSLYPSIIRTFKVDPYARIQAQRLDKDSCVPGYKGIRFARQDSILPEIIESLWQARDKAKKHHNTTLSQAIKIIMNSFYGVLGTSGCRLHDARLTSSITLRGHDLIKKTVELIEAEGYDVIYGDTDSVFVALGAAKDNASADRIGQQLVETINHYWQKNLAQQYHIESFLDMEYETHFKRFFMPTIRGSDKGSKKRYAGIIDNGQSQHMVFKGLEAVRSDWTSLAREVQQEVYHRVFSHRDYDEYLRNIVRRLKLGEFDDQLVYRKRLRQKLSDYRKNRPPHAQAAIKAQAYARAAHEQAQRYENGGWIEYVITGHGPEPLEYNEHKLDYEHYIEKQIAPVVDPILMLLDSSLAKVIQKQCELF